MAVKPAIAVSVCSVNCFAENQCGKFVVSGPKSPGEGDDSRIAEISPVDATGVFHFPLLTFWVSRKTAILDLRGPAGRSTFPMTGRTTRQIDQEARTSSLSHNSEKLYGQAVLQETDVLLGIS